MGSPEKVSVDRKEKKTDISLRPQGHLTSSIAAKAKMNNKTKTTGKDTGKFSFSVKPGSKITQAPVKRLGTKRERVQVSPGEREEVPKKVSLETGKSKVTESKAAGSPDKSKVSDKAKGEEHAASPIAHQVSDSPAGDKVSESPAANKVSASFHTPPSTQREQVAMVTEDAGKSPVAAETGKSLSVTETDVSLVTLDTGKSPESPNTGTHKTPTGRSPTSQTLKLRAMSGPYGDTLQNQEMTRREKEQASTQNIETEQGHSEVSENLPNEEVSDNISNEEVSENTSNEEEGWQKATRRRKRTNPNLKRQHLHYNPPDAEFPVIIEGMDPNRPFSGVAYQVSALDQLGIRVKNLYRMSGRDRTLASCASKNAQVLLCGVTSIARVPVKTFAPRRESVGVIRGVPYAYSEGDLKDLIKESNAQVTRVQRIFSKRQEMTQAVKITFSCTPLPKEVRFDGKTLTVEPFTPDINRCTRCQMIGHYKKLCRSEQVKCRVCGEGGHSALERGGCPQKKDPKCVNCGGKHASSHWYCPYITKYQLTQGIVAVHSLPFNLVMENLDILEKFSKDKLLNPWMYSRADFLEKEKEPSTKDRMLLRKAASRVPLSPIPKRGSNKPNDNIGNFLEAANRSGPTSAKDKTTVEPGSESAPTAVQGKDEGATAAPVILADKKKETKKPTGQVSGENRRQVGKNNPVVFADGHNTQQVSGLNFLQRDTVKEDILKAMEQRFQIMERAMEEKIATSKSQILTEIASKRHQELDETLQVLKNKAANGATETEKTFFGFLSALVGTAIKKDYAPLQQSINNIWKAEIPITDEVKRSIDAITHSAVLNGQ